MTKKEPPNNKQLAVLMASVLLPTIVTGKLLSFLLPQPFAWAISVFAWTFAVYWIPPRPKISPWRWLIIVALISATVLFLVAVDLNPF